MRRYSLLLFHSWSKVLLFKPFSMLCRLLETAIYDHYIRFRDVQGEQKEYIYKEAQGASTRFWQRALDAKGSLPAGILPKSR